MPPSKIVIYLKDGLLEYAILLGGRMISAGKVVTMSYLLSNSKNEELDRASANEPFTYLHGVGQIVPGLEKALEGLKVGEKKQIKVSPEEAYGSVNKELLLTVERSAFPKDMKIQEGFEFSADIGKGKSHHFRVLSLEGDKVHIDGNHPLAGETLFFSIEIIEVRDATDEEKSHGHAHGPEGHHHH